MIKKLVFMLLIGALIGIFSVQTTLAVNANWAKEQEEGFKTLGVKEGEVYNAENWQGLEGALPPSILDYVKKGEFEIEIGKMKWDYSADETYEGFSKANKGKYKIGGGDSIVIAATGEMPDYVQGAPFPRWFVDVKNDPQAGLKIMHNNSLSKMRVGAYFCEFDVQWISDQDMDRFLYGEDNFYYIWNRPDGKQIPNPQKVRRFGMTLLTKPFDLKGSAMLYHYWLDGRPERFVQYIPALRRIKKMNTTDRSSPFFGTDFCNDDGGGFVGQPESMNWKIKELKHVLVPIAYWNVEGPTPCEEMPGGGWMGKQRYVQTWGYDDKYKGKKYNITWAPNFCKWVPRKMYNIGMYAKDPYYAYGDQECWVDVDNEGISYKIVWDKSGAYWKTLIVNNAPFEWENGTRVSMSSQNFYVNIDDKTHHASICGANQEGANGNEYKTVLNWYKNTPQRYKDEALMSLPPLNP